MEARQEPTTLSPIAKVLSEHQPGATEVEERFAQTEIEKKYPNIVGALADTRQSITELLQGTRLAELVEAAFPAFFDIREQWKSSHGGLEDSKKPFNVTFTIQAPKELRGNEEGTRDFWLGIMRRAYAAFDYMEATSVHFNFPLESRHVKVVRSKRNVYGLKIPVPLDRLDSQTTEATIRMYATRPKAKLR